MYIYVLTKAVQFRLRNGSVDLSSLPHSFLLPLQYSAATLEWAETQPTCGLLASSGQKRLFFLRGVECLVERVAQRIKKRFSLGLSPNITRCPTAQPKRSDWARCDVCLAV